MISLKVIKEIFFISCLFFCDCFINDGVKYFKVEVCILVELWNFFFLSLFYSVLFDKINVCVINVLRYKIKI